MLPALNVPQLNLMLGAAQPFDFDNSDVVIGIKDETVNKAIKAFYDNQKIRNKYLRGYQEWDFLKLSLFWDLRKSPYIRFDGKKRDCSIITDLYEEELLQALKKTWGNFPDEDFTLSSTQLKELLDGSSIDVDLVVEGIYVKLTNTETGLKIDGEFDCTITCNISLNNDNMLIIAPIKCSTKREHLAGLLSTLNLFESIYKSAAAVGDGIIVNDDKLILFVIDFIIFPKLVQIVKPMLPKINLFNLKIYDFKINDIKFFTEQGYLIAGANVDVPKDTKGLQKSFENVELPGGGFFVILNKGLLQRTAEYMVVKCGEQSFKEIYLVVNYGGTVKISHPVMNKEDIRGDEFGFGFNLLADPFWYVNFFIPFVPTWGLGFIKITSGKPYLKTRLYIDDNEIHAKVIEMNNDYDFEIVFDANPVGFAVEKLANLFKDVTKKIIKYFVEDTDIKLMKINPFPFEEFKEQFDIELDVIVKDAQIKGFESKPALTGNIEVKIK